MGGGSGGRVHSAQHDEHRGAADAAQQVEQRVHGRRVGVVDIVHQQAVGGSLTRLVYSHRKSPSMKSNWCSSGGGLRAHVRVSLGLGVRGHVRSGGVAEQPGVIDHAYLASRMYKSRL